MRTEKFYALVDHIKTRNYIDPSKNYEDYLKTAFINNETFEPIGDNEKQMWLFREGVDWIFKDMQVTTREPIIWYLDTLKIINLENYNWLDNVNIRALLEKYSIPIPKEEIKDISNIPKELDYKAIKNTFSKNKNDNWQIIKEKYLSSNPLNEKFQDNPQTIETFYENSIKYLPWLYQAVGDISENNIDKLSLD